MIEKIDRTACRWRGHFMEPVEALIAANANVCEVCGVWVKVTYARRPPRFCSKKCAREALFRRLQADPDDRGHGTLRGYNAGCKCAACVRVGKDYMTAFRAKRKALANAGPGR